MQRLSSFARGLGGGGRAEEAEDRHAPAENRTLFQSFEWYLPGPSEEGSQSGRAPSHYALLTALLPHLAALGISDVWLPPGCKAISDHDTGYGIYDLWDLGEFDAKGHIRTKWGDRAELQTLCDTAKELGVGMLWDAVLNHKAGADAQETSRGIKVDPKDRTKHLTKPYELETWTKFTFPGRGAKYSAMQWNWNHFSGVDYDARRKEHGVFQLVGDGKRSEWAKDVSEELGNYDYLMFADIDHSHPAARSDIFNWGAWISSTLNLSGMRLDAIKHYSLAFLADFIAHLDQTRKELFFVGEYWDSDSDKLRQIVDLFRGRLHLFDVQLVYNLTDFSKGRRTDLRTVLDGTLVSKDPDHAVTFVANHDTQETQSLAAPVEEWFVPLAYALILLRRDGGTPCVFWGDVFGNHGPRPRLPACGGKLARLILARKLYAYGAQRDYFDDADDCVGWTRLGHRSRSNGAGLAVIMTNSWDRRSKKMSVGHKHAGERWRDVMGWEDRPVVIDSRGFGTFPVGHRSLGVWTDEAAPDFDPLSRVTFPRMGQALPPITTLPL